MIHHWILGCDISEETQIHGVWHLVNGWLGPRSEGKIRHSNLKPKYVEIISLQLWPWLLVITGYFYGILHSINRHFVSTYNWYRAITVVGKSTYGRPNVNKCSSRIKIDTFSVLSPWGGWSSNYITTILRTACLTPKPKRIKRVLKQSHQHVPPPKIQTGFWMNGALQQ